MKDASRNRLLALLLNGLPAWLLVLVGAGVVAASLLADRLGFGGQPGVFGWKQILGLVIGGAVAGTGLWVAGRLRARLRRGETDSRAMHSRERAVVDEEPVYDSAEVRIPFVYELRELYRYRYLLRNLVSRDLKVRYKRSVLGFLWAMVNPLLTMGVMVIVFTNLFRATIEHYPIYVLSGILLWQFFARGTSTAMRSVLDNAGISAKIYVPASVFVASPIGSALVNLGFALIPLLLFALLMGLRPSPSWLFLPVPIVLVGMLGFGVGCIVAALAVFFADIIDIYEVLLHAFFYLTPILYPVTILPEVVQSVQQFNPMHRLIDAFRIALIHGELPGTVHLFLAVSAAVLVLIAGWSLFTRLADRFPYRA